MDENELEVGYKSIGGISEKFELAIPSYQRPYVWKEENINDLIEDIKLAKSLGKENYLIGNVILHRREKDDKEMMDIVDGQQRLTTISLILKELGDDSFKIGGIDIKSPNIENASNFIERKKKENCIDDDFANYLKKNVYITYVITNKLDEAFVLFNSQNTRGRPLHDNDLLKGHHIRFIERKDIQRDCAIKFENSLKEKVENGDVLTNVLELLSIIRTGAKGEIPGRYLQEADIYNNFKSEFISDEISFNRYHNNFVATSSIQGGVAFFKYLEKYTDLYLKLCKDDTFKCYDDLWGGNRYLAKIYKAILLFFHDKFEDNTYEIEKNLQIILLNIRLNADRLAKEHVAGETQKFFIDIELSSNKIVVKNKFRKYIADKIKSLDFKKDGWQIDSFINSTYFIDDIKRKFSQNGER